MEGVTDVVLLAALVGDPVCKRNPEVAPAVNVEGAMRVAAAAADGSPERFVFASTCSNYGLRDENDPPAVETDELKPLSIYAENKVEVESRLLGDAPLDGVDATVMRVSTAYGMSQRMRFDLTVSEFTRELTLGDELDVYDADTWRPYCHVRRHRGGDLTVLEAPADVGRGEVFNLGGTDENYTKRMVVEAALDALDGEGKVCWVEGGVRRPQLPRLVRQDQGRPRVRARSNACRARSRTWPRRSGPASSTMSTDRPELLQRNYIARHPRESRAAGERLMRARDPRRRQGHAAASVHDRPAEAARPGRRPADPRDRHPPARPARLHADRPLGRAPGRADQGLLRGRSSCPRGSSSTTTGRTSRSARPGPCA